MSDFEGTSLEKENLNKVEGVDFGISEVLKATPLELEQKKVIEEPKPQVSTITAETPIEKPAAKEKSPSMDYSKIKVYQTGDFVKGKVISIEKNGVLIDIDYKSEAFIELSELTSKTNVSPEQIVSIGDEIEAVISQLESKDGYVIVSKKQADYERAWKTLIQALKKRQTLEAEVVSAVTGGLVVDYWGIRGFIPASQVLKRHEEKLFSFIGKKMLFKVLEVDRNKKKVVFSHRLAEEEEQRLQNGKFFDDLDVGQIKRGKVSSIKNFGVFVNLGAGVEGLVHISELSWKRISHPSEIVSLGSEIDVFVLGVDREAKKISLGLKQLQPDPWVEAKDLYMPGQIIEGKVTRLVKFGAFVELGNGLEGLIHLVELAYPAPAKPDDVVKVGQVVKVKVLRVIPEEQKIGLSLKDVFIQEHQTDSAPITLKDVIDKDVSAQLENVRNSSE